MINLKNIHRKTAPKPTLMLTCVRIIVHNCHTQHSTEQFW